jgi:hypothetical protein
MKGLRTKELGKQADSAGSQSQQPRFLAYALPRAENDTGMKQVLECDGFSLHDEPLGSRVSFLDFDGIVGLAGVYETLEYRSIPRMRCIAKADLDLRQREFFTVFEQRKTIIFLVPKLPRSVDGFPMESDSDLFRAIVSNCEINWDCRKESFPAVESIVPEFREFVGRYGAGYVVFQISDEHKEWVKPICLGNRTPYGIVVGGRLFFLPCVMPQTHEQIIEIAGAAIHAAIAYRKRILQEMPEWTAEFAFGKESLLRTQASGLREQITHIEGQIDGYVSFKGALCYQSDPLVEVVRKMLDHFFGISLMIDDKYIEDATLRDAQGTIQAVFEVKAVKGNFTRANVNQVDSHRERLGLASTVPGVLIMNTLMGVNSLQEKDQSPHPEIIEKAVADRVLLIRTLDLLRYADGIEQGNRTKEDFRNTILTESGWLKVENDTAEIVKR